MIASGTSLLSRQWIAGVALAATFLSACSSSPRPSAGPSPSASPALSIVALGDSDATGAGDPTGRGWVGRYAGLLEEKVGVHADVSNLAAEGKTSDQLLSEVRSDSTTRETLGGADIVLIGLGGADLNAGDADLEAGSCRGKACYTPVLRTFGHNFETIVAEIRDLRTSPTVLRAITLANVFPGAGSLLPPFATPELALYQAKSERQIICRTMTRYEGRCVDVLRAFNGPGGTENAYKTGLMNKENCCYPSAKGQQLIAELLLKTGLAPVRS